MIGMLAAEIADSVTEILLWGASLLAAVIVLFGGVWYYRSRWLNPDESEPRRQPWTLDDLRQMKQQGQISDEEYQALRESIVAAFRGSSGGSGATSGRESVSSRWNTQDGSDVSE
jgi:hypothetical protein